jgi:hypothetical protein
MLFERPGEGDSSLYVTDLDGLWLYWADPPPNLTGSALRQAAFVSFATALQARWLCGGYAFLFAEDARPAGATVDDDASRACAMIAAVFPKAQVAPSSVAWRTPDEALDDFLDGWLFFRQSHPYVQQNDVPTWMDAILRTPWASIMRELGAGEAGGRAAVLEGEGWASGRGDHYVTLMLAAGGRLCMLHVDLWTD